MAGSLAGVLTAIGLGLLTFLVEEGFRRAGNKKIALVVVGVGGVASLTAGLVIARREMPQQWRDVREAIATDPAGANPPVTALEDYEANLRGTGPASHVVIIGPNVDYPASNELRVYDQEGGRWIEKYSLSFSSSQFQVAHLAEGDQPPPAIGDYDNDGLDEAFVGVRDLQGMGPSYLHPAVLEWQDATSSYELREIRFDAPRGSQGIGRGDLVETDPEGTQTRIRLHTDVLDWAVAQILHGVPVIVTAYDPYPNPTSHITAWKVASWQPSPTANLCSRTTVVRLRGVSGRMGQDAAQWWLQNVGDCKHTRPAPPLPG